MALAGKRMRLAGICLARSEITMRQVIPPSLRPPRPRSRDRRKGGCSWRRPPGWQYHNSVLTVLRGKADCGSFRADQLEQRKQPRRAVFASLIYTEHNGVFLTIPCMRQLSDTAWIPETGSLAPAYQGAYPPLPVLTEFRRYRHRCRLAELVVGNPVTFLCSGGGTRPAGDPADG